MYSQSQQQQPQQQPQMSGGFVFNSAVPAASQQQQQKPVKMKTATKKKPAIPWQKHCLIAENLLKNSEHQLQCQHRAVRRIQALYSSARTNQIQALTSMVSATTGQSAGDVMYNMLGNGIQSYHQEYETLLGPQVKSQLPNILTSEEMAHQIRQTIASNQHQQPVSDAQIQNQIDLSLQQRDDCLKQSWNADLAARLKSSEQMEELLEQLEQLLMTWKMELKCCEETFPVLKPDQVESLTKMVQLHRRSLVVLATAVSLIQQFGSADASIPNYAIRD